MGDMQKKWVKLSEMAQVTTLNTICSKRQKKDVGGAGRVRGGQLKEAIRKNTVKKGKFVSQR